ncbi:MAG: glycosyltransferase [Gammaproteobacteria bacterium]|nr:glycosyltransferase [Gammaproteobacteria bacterium]MBU1406931.1 glycosyltransferase [Gammaproteobacteria bacterium]MBU1533074.1 glycosyltransferase [Gammaproteobacteria bacterium]
MCVRIDKKSGGGSVAAIELARVFVAAGLEVDNWIVVDPSDGDLLNVQDLRVEIFKTDFGSSRYRFSIDFTKALRTRLREYDVVILSGLYLYPNSIASYYCGKQGVPYILFPYDSFNPEKLGHSRLQKTIYRLLFDNAMVRGATLIQAANEAERRQVVGYTNRTENVFVASFGFNIEDFSKKRPGLLFQNMVPWDVEHTKTILYLARVSKTKGVETLIEAYEKLVRTDACYRLLIVGPAWDAEYNEHLLERFHELISEQKIHFSGLVSDDEKYACFQKSYLYVLPSYAENFGITVLEAISNRLVPIVTDSVPWQELEDHNAGFRVPTRDADAILRAVLCYANLPEQKRKEMKENAFNLAFKFDYGSIAKVYLEALRKAAGLGAVRS